jgi:hypothetical protein
VKFGPPALAMTGAGPKPVEARAGADIENAAGVGVGVGVGVDGGAGFAAIPPPSPPVQAVNPSARAMTDPPVIVRMKFMPSSFSLRQALRSRDAP